MSTESTDGSVPGRRARPESFRARALGASLTVDDIQESLAWYRDVVGFTVAREHEEDGELAAAELIAGSVRVWIAQDDGAKGWDRDKGEGFSLQFSTAQDIDQLASDIEARGGTLVSGPTEMPWGARVFRLEDPNGFKLAISSVG